MNNNSVTIRISRNKNIADSRSIAIIKLNKLEHKVGQPVMVKYYTDSTKTTIDTVVAIGIKDGIGKDCYKVISLGGLILVRGVNTKNLPDVSELNEGELFLYKENVSWHYVYLEDKERVVEKIENLPPTVFVSIEDKFRWFWKDGVLKREDDFYSGDNMEALIDDLFYIIGPPKFTTIIKGWYNNETGEFERPPYMPDKSLDKIIIIVDVKNSISLNITEKFKYYIDGEEYELKYDEINKEYYIELLNISETQVFNINAQVTAISGETYTYSSIIKITFGYYCYYGYDKAEEFNNINDWIGKNGYYKFLNYKKELIAENSTVIVDNIELKKPGKVFIVYPINKLIHIYDEHGLDYIEEDYTVYEIYIDPNNAIPPPTTTNTTTPIPEENKTTTPIPEENKTSTPVPLNLLSLDEVDKDSSLIKYYLYILNTPIIIDDFKQTYISSEDTEDLGLGEAYIDQVKYDEILNAWDNKNKSRGLVQLNENGKIKEELLPSELKTLNFSLIEIIDIVNNIPNTLGFNEGDKWIIISETGISVYEKSEGGNKTYDVEENTIYIKENTMYVLDSTKSSLSILGGTINSTRITNLIEEIFE